MTRHLPSFRALAALEAVVRTGNIVRAADELGVSPGAISKQLSNLEAELQVALFEEGHRLRPTKIAVDLARAVGEALNQVRQAWSEASHRADERVLTLIANASLSMHWLVPRLLSAQEALRGRPIRVTSLHTTDNWWQVPVDFAVLRHGRAPAGWVVRAIAVERLTLLATPERGRWLTGRGLAAVAGEECLTAETRAGELEAWMRAAGCERLHPPRRYPHFYIALEGALAGHGSIVGPTLVAADLLRQGRLTAPFPDISITGATLNAAFNPATCDHRTAEALLAWLGEEMQRSVPPQTLPPTFVPNGRRGADVP